MRTPTPIHSSAVRPRRPLAFTIWAAFFLLANTSAVVLFAFHHYTAALVVFFSPAPWLFFQVVMPTARDLGPVVTRFATTGREVWLTIDDGPDPATTPAILDLLDAHAARATFFLIGQNVTRYPTLAAEIVRRGHTLGNHTHTHPCWPFWCASSKTIATEIDVCADALQQAGGGVTRWFRSPVGLKNISLHRLLAERDLDFVLWSARGFDGISRDPTTVVARIFRTLKPGAIILIHEGKKNALVRVEALNALLAQLRSEGYACVIPSPDSLVRSA